MAMDFLKNPFFETISLVYFLTCSVLSFYVFWKTFFYRYFSLNFFVMILNILLLFSLKIYVLWMGLDHKGWSTNQWLYWVFLIFSFLLIRFYIDHNFSFILPFSCWVNIFQIFSWKEVLKAILIHVNFSSWFSTFHHGVGDHDSMMISL